MAGDWTEITVGEAFEVSPSRTLKRGDVAPFIPMDALPVHARAFERIDYREFTGSGTRFKNGDTLIARITPCLENGKTAYVAGLPDNSVGHGSTEYIVLAGRESLSDGLFGYYLARSPDFRRYAIGHMEGTSGRQRVPGTAIEKYVLALPPLPEQRAIAHILGTLDDKIELNRRRSQALEAMARALFKDWFVDFGPVRAKMEGKRPYLSAALWQLFPDRLDDEGRPEGWESGRLDDALVLQRGFDLPASARTHGVYPVMAASGINGYHDRYMVKGPGITTGRSGVLGRVFFVQCDFWPLNTSLWVKEFKRVSPLYAFELLRGLDFEMFNAGSAVPTLNRNHVHNLPIILPPEQLINAFDRQVMPMRTAQKRSEDECGFLAQLRDTLLPKLISGELRIAEAERFLARAEKLNRVEITET